MFVYTLNDGLTDLMHPILLIIYNAMIFYHSIIIKYILKTSVRSKNLVCVEAVYS